MTRTEPIQAGSQFSRDNILKSLGSIAQLLSSQSGTSPALSAVLEILESELGMLRSTVLLLSADGSELLVQALRKPIHRISTMAINMMLAYHWPGNVRELENFLEYAVLLSTDGVIHGHHLPPTLQTPNAEQEPHPGRLRERIAIMEEDAIIDALKRSDGNGLRLTSTQISKEE